jgi:hypothetical protein
MRNMWTNLVVILAVVTLVGVGCGPEENSPGPNNVQPSSNGHTDTGDTTLTPDAGDAGGDSTGADAGDASDAEPGGDTEDDGGDASMCPSTPCYADQLCVNGSCVAVTAETKCGAAEDLGNLSLDATLTASGTFVDGSDALKASCSEDPDLAEKIFRFQVDQDSRIDYDTTWEGNFAAVVDFRTSCTDATSALTCSDSDAAIGFVAAGTEVFLVVEIAQGLPGDFTVELSATEESCPQGQRSCTSNELEICEGGGASQTYGCAGTCATADACGGDICPEAIEVTQSQTFKGDLQAYSSNFNFENATSCQTAGGTPIPTPGADIIFALPNLTTSNTVTIDAETNDSNLNRIFVLADPCAQPDQCTAVGGTDEIVDFTPPSDGTYYVVIDKSTASSAAFEYSFTLD